VKRFNQLYALFCILAVAGLALGACTPESSSAAVEPAETSRSPQTDEIKGSDNACGGTGERTTLEPPQTPRPNTGRSAFTSGQVPRRRQ